MVEDTRSSSEGAWSEFKRSATVAGLSTFAAFALGLAGLVGSIFGLLDQAEQKPLVPIAASSSLETRRQISNLQADVQHLQAQLLPVSGETSPDAREVAQLSLRIDQIDKRQRALERVILTNPGKALELPMMRRDLDALRDANVQAATYQKDAVDRVYTLSISLIGALALGVLSIAVNLFLRGRISRGSDE